MAEIVNNPPKVDYVIGYAAAFTITFDPNGGTVSTTSATSDGKLSSLPTPNLTGYNFNGWYIGSEKVTENTVFKANTTVTARWTKIGGVPGGTESGGGSGWVAPSKPTVTIDGDKKGGNVEASQNSVTITPEDGYQVTVNGKEVNIPADNKLTGLKSTDKVVVTFEKIPDPAPIPVSQRFTDVPAGAWYEDAVQFVVDLFFGTAPTVFEPESPMTRAILATVLWRHQGCGVVNYAMNYGDVDQGAWYAEAIRWAASDGVVGGYGNGLFGPNDNITREQLAVMLWRYAGSPAATHKELHFADADQTIDWAMEAMRWAVENGIINGYDGRLDPHGQAHVRRSRLWS